MGELRKDYFTNRFVIIPDERTRPFDDLETEGWEVTESNCPLCPGNEAMMPPADLVLIQKEGSLIKGSDSETEPVSDWVVRGFLSKYPVVTTNPSSAYSDSPLYSEPSYGYHYIMAATPNHNGAFGKIDVDQWINILAAVQDKVKWLYGRSGVSYVAVLINCGREAGATLMHPHLQIVTLPRIPPVIEEETTAVQKSMHEMGVCPMCTIVGVETGGPRQILATDFFVAFTPWASTHTYEFWLFPKKHQTSFPKITQKEIGDLALILRSTLGGLAKTFNDPPFNLVFHISSEKKSTKQIHWHIEVYPQITKWTGLERGTGIYANQVPPEQAAEVLGASSRKELAELMGIT